MNKSLILILVFAAITRLSFLGLIEYKADEALTVLSLRQFVKQPHVIEAGLVSSTGARNFPLFQYLLIPAALISTDPRWLSGFIGLITVMMIGWFFIATKQEFGNKIAIIASLILIVAPYPLLYSRKIWAQDLVWLLAVPIYKLMLQIRKRNYSFLLLLWLGILLALQAQLHASGLFLVIAMVGYLLFKRIRLWGIIAGAAIGAIPALPYLWLQLTSTPRFPDLMAYQQLSGQLNNHPEITHLLLPFEYMTNGGWSEIMGAADYQKFVTTTPAQGMSMLASIVLVLGMGYGIVRSFKDKAYRMMGLLMIGLVGIYFVAAVPARLHYYQVLAPYIAVMSALGLVKLFKSQPLFLGPTIGFIVLADVLFIGMFWRYLTVNIGVMGDYGVPYQFSQPRVQQVIEPYTNRGDIDTIAAYAHFDPSLAKYSNSASIHAYLSRYFLMMGETTLASDEGKLAGSLFKK